MLINDKSVVVVTGSGGTGCGRAIARRLARDGAAVLVADLNEAGGRETVRLITDADRGRASFFPADVRDERQVREMISLAETRFGGLDVLVNNASGPYRPSEPLDHWIDTIQTELMGAVHGTRFAIDAMRRRGGGAIVNIASISALWHGERNAAAPAYDVAKAGMIRLTTALGALARKDHIRVNCLAPGWIATDGPRQYWESLTPEQRAQRGVPSKLLTAEEVADIVRRLATDESLAGRVLVWWSEDVPRLIEWGDRGYAGTTTLAAEAS